ncbi:MAG: M14 family metallopeptidase [Planctomycetota bacterium]|nr:M14 family metallopeptidase [Planctomycetota bacterium]
MHAPKTKAEATNWRETSRHADVMEFVAALQARGDARLCVGSFGASPEGRELPLLVLNSRGIHTPEEAKRSGLPIVLVINGIHAGEVEGKEAALMMVRDLLDRDPDQLLERLVIVVVPLFNPDGNDRIDPANRVLNLAKFEGQIGPAGGVGTRANASGINLNRDYMRQDAAEMQLLQSRVCRPWKPHLTIDCHSTNGSVHRFQLTYDVPHTIESGRVEPILYMREMLVPAVQEAVRRNAGFDTSWYGNFVEDEGGVGEGWMTYTHHPRFGSNYRGLTNRLDLLLEAYSYQSFETRVAVTYAFVKETLRFARDHGGEIVELVERCILPPRRIAVRSTLERFDDPITILTRKPRTLDGAPIAVTIPFIGRFLGSEFVDRPFGYVLTPEAAAHLERHGLTITRITEDVRAEVEIARVEKSASETSRAILEASAEREIEVVWRHDTRTLKAGTPIVATEQPLGAIAVYMCEPRSDDGFVACGVLAEPRAGADFPIQRLVDAVV